MPPLPTSSFSAFFQKNIGTISHRQQQILQKSTVSVIGCGGLGGYVCEGLARFGVGMLRICDPDFFEPSNCNRQLHARQSSIGHAKAEIVKQKIAAIHPYTIVKSYKSTFQETGHMLFRQTDVVVDCLDSRADRLQLADLCIQFQRALVHGAVEGWYGQAGVQMVNSNLLQQLYSIPEKKKQSPSVLSCTVSLVASIQVAETVKLLLKMDSPLHNTWMSIDLQRLTFDLINDFVSDSG